MSRALAEPVGASFREDAPRPPVPGEEGEGPRRVPADLPPPVAVPVPVPGCGASRRNEDGLGEPEGSASPDSPLARWTKSLHLLLGDQDGAHLFRTFLEREKGEDALDFWFACNGFRQMDLKDAKTQRVARAIYKRYVEASGVVAEQMKPATRSYIRDSIKKQRVDSAMFDQAQTEIQAAMEEKAYQMFLTSDIYLDYVHSGCENAAYAHQSSLAGLKVMCGYLPPLIEDKEWTCGDLKAKALATVVGLSAKSLRATMTLRTAEGLEHGCRAPRRGDPASPYFMNSGHVFAPASSANDSEVSSDATTDDSMSMTDSSVDGIPPYKLGMKKQLQREMHRSVKINGQVSLPHFPRTHRLPREMAPVEPSAFAAELIARLEKLKREQDTLSCLEERLQQIQEEEERDEGEVAAPQPPASLSLLPSGFCEEDPQAILDDHLSRVLKTPGCQSPGVPVYSPRSRSPDHSHHHHQHHHQGSSSSPLSDGPYSILGKVSPAGPQPSSKHIHHHYIHHHHGAPPKSKEQIEAEAAHRVAQCLGSAGGSDYSFQRCHSPAELPAGRTGMLSKRPSKASDGMSICQSSGEGSSSPQLPLDGTDRSQNVWQWILGSERQGRHKPHSSQGLKKTHPTEPMSSSKTPLWGGGGVGGHAQRHHPGHPFVQDPTMPPLPPPNTLTQLEEACRRLEEASKPTKQRHSASSLQRERVHPSLFPNAGSNLISPALQMDEWKEQRRPSTGHSSAPSGSELVVTYFFCGEEIPYRRLMKTHSLTLGHFKEQLRKKGNYRYYFKKASDEFECGAVFEEIWEDGTVLPMYEGKILGKVERMD
ncbi:axin-2 [Astyanax mexicanus]|uniref:axin-2 n=1 Tax=Astyanax mexicanus TaxID=7994 RepID=UPI0020CB210B|nr:axin-2 [Astyanax mexicanus]XP_049335152.1 axin-2 [Astyanax mexicanus]XP_049335154.1 axin-2 [Astyanax mexicanus]